MAYGVKKGMELQLAYNLYYTCSIYATATEVILSFSVPDIRMPDGTGTTLPFAAGEWEFVVAVME
jgi:hypothetical protein